MHIFHIATVADWTAARRSGTYTTSTIGRTLEQEGFIHAASRAQVAPVWRAFYAGVREPLVLLTIETDRLEVPWRDDEVTTETGQVETFPHIYGPLSPRAVVDVRPLNKRGGTESFLSLMVKEMARPMAIALVAMLVSVAGVQAGRAVGGAWGPFLGGVAGLVVGGTAAWVAVRRRR